jgi:hypothetical protein
MDLDFGKSLTIKNLINTTNLNAYRELQSLWVDNHVEKLNRDVFVSSTNKDFNKDEYFDKIKIASGAKKLILEMYAYLEAKSKEVH